MDTNDRLIWQLDKEVARHRRRAERRKEEGRGELLRARFHVREDMPDAFPASDMTAFFDKARERMMQRGNTVQTTTASDTDKAMAR
ncbi:hypothetical protein LCGC14_2190430 [marine sediment metagenome]|uniref:Uncharacterized protein n=1 Tax=marine sediment metagenome TaxID=412755 RepID=A0A0F9DJR2_9ZZZZ